MVSSKRAAAALAGCALGDAMGMPTELMDRKDLKELFPNGVSQLYGATDRDVFGRHLEAGKVTDDTAHTVLLTRMLIERKGQASSEAYISYLQDWVDEDPEYAAAVTGSNTLGALRKLANGASLDRSGIFGTTNGGAMKIGPIGIVYDYHDLEGLVDAVEEICRPTHNTGAAIACASAVAAAVSYGVRGGSDLNEMFALAYKAAQAGEDRGYGFPTASVSKRMMLVHQLVEDEPASEAIDQIRGIWGMGVEAVETCPAVFAMIFLGEGNPWNVAQLCAGMGGDTDTIGALATEISAAMNPEALPAELVEEIEKVNDLDFNALAQELARFVQ